MEVLKGYKGKYIFKYVCNKCRRSIYRTLGEWKIECMCGGMEVCHAAPWKPERRALDSDLEKLIAYRKSKKYSQALMGAELDMDQSTYSRLERGLVDLTDDLRSAIYKIVNNL